ncbi:MAG: sugar kinase [Planctomycetes bacterium]|nr:sugar kinase [Planctomycetota bacterium]
MNPVLVVGSVALDTIETPLEKCENLLGGSATYFSLAARHFTPVRVVGVVGHDFPQIHRDLFHRLRIDTEGLQTAARRTFRWHGRYDQRLSGRETLSVDLEILDLFRPELPDSYGDSKFALLGNTSPATQERVLRQLHRPTFVMLDTMDIWIRTEREPLAALLPKVHALCINQEEALMLADSINLVQAARRLLEAGLKCLIIKRAEHGATMITRDFAFSVPAFPTEQVTDPTGAGDAFAGGFLGYLAKTGVDASNLRRALLYATVMGSLAVESFGPDRIASAALPEIDRRFAEMVRIISL